MGLRQTLTELPFKEDKEFMGHNSKVLDSFSADLRSAVEEAERIQALIDDHKRDLADHFAVLKSKGYSVKTIRKILAMRRQDPDKRADEDMQLRLYLDALDM